MGSDRTTALSARSYSGKINFKDQGRHSIGLETLGGTVYLLVVAESLANY